MKRLILMRHAKSDWSQGGLRDYDRPLSQRGVTDARKMGKWLASQTEPPQIILYSTARRTQQTKDLFLLGLQATGADVNGIESRGRDEMYLSSSRTLINLARDQLNQSESVMLVAHNPGMDGILSHYSPDAPHTADGKLMTTANIAIIEFDDLFNPTLITLQRPKELCAE